MRTRHSHLYLVLNNAAIDVNLANVPSISTPRGSSGRVVHDNRVGFGVGQVFQHPAPYLG